MSPTRSRSASVISISSTDNPIVSKKTGRPILQINLISDDEDASPPRAKKARLSSLGSVDLTKQPSTSCSPSSSRRFLASGEAESVGCVVKKNQNNFGRQQSAAGGQTTGSSASHNTLGRVPVGKYTRKPEFHEQNLPALQTQAPQVAWLTERNSYTAMHSRNAAQTTPHIALFEERGIGKMSEAEAKLNILLRSWVDEGIAMAMRE